MTDENYQLHLKYLGINTYKEPIIYMREDCSICRSEGFEAQARVQVTLRDRSLIATLNTIESDLLRDHEASLSHYAWDLLQAKDGDEIAITHPKSLDSLSYIRSKLYGNELKTNEITQIINDILAGQLSDIHIAMFLSATAGDRLNKKEVLDLTRSMVQAGQKLKWRSQLIVDKHCVGGLPGNRTTLIVVPIVAAYGLTIPKTSSRAITSPAGTADTMEVFAPVNLDIQTMQKIVEQENGCIVWGGAIDLSPADDLLIRIEHAMDLDSEGQMVASILSKKIAAGSTNLLIDIPIGPTAKVRSDARAESLKNYLETIANEFSIKLRVIFTDGFQPVGRGIGPALEARDVLSVLSCDKSAPQDLRDRALTLAGHILEFSPDVPKGKGKQIATSLLDNGKALNKFQAICKAQGGMFEIPVAPYTHVVTSKKSGKIINIDNRYIARLAKLAGAPQSKVAGVDLLVSLNSIIEKNQPLFTVHAEAKGELKYALSFLEQGHEIFHIEEI
jgi:thymidine phosphorylase